MSNQAEWQTGYYSYQNLEHIFNTNMLCLKSYLSVQQGTNYQVDLPESIELTIREIDANGIVIRSVTKLNGSTYIPSEKASYVALSMSGEKEKLLREELIAIISEGQFRMVGSDVVADEIIYEITLEEPSVTPEPLIAEKSDATIIENCDFSELSNWQSGYYTFADANLAAHASRIAFVDYKRFISGNTYEAVLPENRTFVIRELAADYSLVKSVNLTNGATYKPSLKTVYLAVSVIVTDNTKTTFAAYEE